METSLNRRAKLELFEQIRREYEHGVGTIKGVARKLGVHRRMVREAIANAVPPARKRPVCERPQLGPATEFIDGILVLLQGVAARGRAQEYRADGSAPGSGERSADAPVPPSFGGQGTVER